MHLGQISFCNGFGLNLKCDIEKQQICNEVMTLLGAPTLTAPATVQHHDPMTSQAVMTKPHLVAVRTVGNPYLLYLTRINGVPQCLFIDRKVQPGYQTPRIIMARLWFKETSLFDGTIFEGEMIRDSSTTPPQQGLKWTFLIGDLLVHQRALLSHVNLIKRINAVYEILSKEFVPDNGMDLFAMRVKKYFKYQELDAMIDTFIPSLPYPILGIIFKSLHLKFRDIMVPLDGGNKKQQLHPPRPIPALPQVLQAVVPQVPQSVSPQIPQRAPPPPPRKKSRPLRMKPTATQHDGDILQTFGIRKTHLPDVYEIIRPSSSRQQQQLKRELACIPDMKHSKAMRMLFASVGVSETIPMRCTLHEKFNKWVPQLPDFVVAVS